MGLIRWATLWFQVTVQLSHLINTFHSLKSSVSNTTGRVQQRDYVPETDIQIAEVITLYTLTHTHPLMYGCFSTNSKRVHEPVPLRLF